MNTPRHILIVMSFLCLLNISHVSIAHAKEDCMGITGDYERRECLSKVYANSEQRIKELVERANTGSDSEHQSYISNSQTAWKNYRDEECALEGDDFRGGTLEKDQAAVCTISKNNERIKEIESDIGLASH